MAQTIKLKRSSVAGNIPSTSDLALGEVAINTADGKMYIKKSVDGTDSIIDLSDSPQDAILQEYQFTASANQTTFSGADDNNDTLYYTAGAVQIFLNGILLDSGVDYTATSNTSIVLAETVDANDYLQVFAFKQKISGGSVTVNTFTGNGSTTAFTLSVNPGDENNTRVFIDGVYQSKSNYSVSATTLTFTTAPPTGTAIEVESGNRDVALDTTTNLDFPDNVKLRLGTSQDLQIYHDGSNSHIKNTGSLYVASETSGDLYLRSDDDIFIQPQGGENGITLTGDGAVTLYHNNVAKLSTDAQGINVTGGIDVADITATGNISLNSDNGTAYFGAGADLRIYHDGNHARIRNTTGNFNIQTDTFHITDSGNVAASFVVNKTGSTSLKYNQAEKLATSNTGITVTGTGTFSGNVDINSDGGQLQFGADNDMQIYHNGANGEINVPATDFTIDAGGDIILDADGGQVYFQDGGVLHGSIDMTSGFIFRNHVSDADVHIQGNDGGSNINALTLDMSQAGRATFNEGIVLKSSKAGDFGVNINTAAGDSMKLQVVDTGTAGNAHGSIEVSDGNLTLDVAGDIILDADGGDIVFRDAGSSKLFISNSSDDVLFTNGVQDKDLIFKGYDGTSLITALTLDMSNAGAATFNSTVTSTGLTLNNNTYAQLQLTGTNETWINFGDASDSDVGQIHYTHSTNKMNFKTNATSALTLDSSGNVNIPTGSLMVGATTAPTHKLEVVGNAMLSTSDGFMYLSNVGVGNAGIYVRGIGQNGTLRSHTTTDFRWEVTGGQKMLLNSSGLDVTGSVTTDGIINSLASEFYASHGGLVGTGSTAKVYATGSAFDGINGSLVLQSRPTAGADVYVAAGATPKVVAKFLDGGDVHFFEDTGVTPKFVWDASAESLGIGTTAPEGQLTLQNDDASLRIRSNTTTAKGLTLRYNHAGNFGHLLVDHQGNNQLDMKYHALSHTFGRSDSLQFMTINSSGNVGIGTSSPSSFSANASNLVVGSGSGTEGITINSGTANYGVIYFADGTSGSAAYAGSINYNHADNSMRLGTNGSTTDVVIDSSGNATFSGSVTTEKTAVNYSSGVFTSPHLALKASVQPDDNDGFVGATFATSDSNNYGYSLGAERTSGGNGDFVLTHHFNSATGSERLRINSSNATFSGSVTAPKFIMTGGSQIGQDYAYLKSNSTTTASLTLRKDSTGADSIDFLQLRSDGNGLIGKIEGDGDISFKNATFSGTISSGAITSTGLNSTSGTVQYTDGGSVFDSSDADGYPRFTVTNGSAQLGLFRAGNSAGGSYIGADSSKLLRVYNSSFSPKFDIDTSGNVTALGSVTSTGLVLNGGRAAEGVTAAGTYAELTRASGGDLGLLFNKDTSKWLIGIDNSDGNAANLRFMYGAYNASIHPGFGSDYSGLNLTYQGRVGVGTRYPGAELEVAGTALVENAKLKAIAASNSDTAVDVFVYDTRKDSDGGAWRKRTQHTSWYNETLNTSIRGARKEFPSVAVIVAETGGITIYDGDDPDLPMWMVISGSGIRYGTVTAGLEMLNGILFFTGNVSCSEINFITEFMGLHQASSISQTKPSWSLGIIERYSSAGSWKTEGAGTGSVIQTGTLVNQATNDVAMTVLPNAPIDAATGLPAPTIALATEGGVSVIKDDGTVVDISFNTIYTFIKYIAFTKDNNIIFSNDAYTSLQRWVKVYEIPSADYTSQTGTNRSGALFSYVPYGTTYSSSYGTNPEHMFPEGVRFLDVIGEAIATDDIGVVKLSEDNKSVAYIASDYNTGWMHVDIKLATLSDTDTTNAVGTELITNGTFTSNTTGWSAGNSATITQQSNGNPGGNINVYSGTGSNGFASQTITTVVGKTYTLSFDYYHVNGNAGGYVNIGTSFAGDQYVYLSLPTTSSWNSHSHTFKATTTTTFVGLYSRSSGNGNARYDNVSLRLAEEDRSYNNNGLQVFGTVTKTAVATGAELVAYSGFTSSNYLRQPYNSDLDFGTGDFSYSFWHSCSFNTPDRIWMSHGQYNVDGSGLSILQHNSSGPGDRIWIYVGTSSNSSHGYLSVDNVEERGFQQWVVTRRSGILYVYRNGKLEGSVANTASVDLSSKTINELYLGVGREASAPFAYGAGPLALFRVSATAPTEEQIAKMYNDEKHLFATNAKAVIGGTSDTVTALAYDDDTELLHVGSSWGRSVFQGLNRVEYSTDVVTTAISASNGFIVEE